MRPPEIVAPGAVVVLQPGAPVTVPSGALTIVIDAASSAGVVRLDGREPSTRRVADLLLVSLDATRSAGFHRLAIGPTTYLFATEDSKVKLEGIEQMLRYLRGSCTWWSGQLFFSDGFVLMDAHVIYGWLDEHADAAIAAADSIARAALSRRKIVRMVSSAPRGRLDVPATLRILRANPRDLLQPSERGSVALGAATYSPRKAVYRASHLTLDSPSNRRVVWLLATLSTFTAHVLQALDDGPERERCEGWQRRALRLLASPPLVTIPFAARLAPPPSAPTAEEQTDRRYAAIFHTFLSLPESRGWSASEALRPLYSYVQQSDVIYQAFVATALAQTLGIPPTSPNLGMKQPAFESREWALYYNVVPPPAVLRTWRSYSSFPDSYRPDVLLHHKRTGQVALIDAKYRQDGDAPPESARKELLAYMAAYGINRAALAFPPRTTMPKPRAISAQGNSLIELALIPAPDVATRLSELLPNLLAQLLVAPPWRDRVLGEATASAVARLPAPIP